MTERSRKSPTAGNCVWTVKPVSSHWTVAANWQPAKIPTKTARFGGSTVTEVGFVANVGATVDSIEFAEGAPSYTFKFIAPAPNTPALTIVGAGIVNASRRVQRFLIASSAAGYENAQLEFINSASAGGADVEYAAGPATPAEAAGGVIGFHDKSTAGSATFSVRTGAGTPPDSSTVGGEVSFSDTSSADAARFTIFGSTSTTDGDTFGNVVFHNASSAASAVFTNVGGTVAGGDGGNTQFYDKSTAASGIFHNEGATVASANGGDVAIDGNASAGSGNYYNYAARAAGGFGGVTSFNNNPPCVTGKNIGATAAKGVFYNHGAAASGEGGGHTYFTARYGSPTAASGTFTNYGSAVAGDESCAGHTVFSISLPRESACGTGPGVNYCPDAGNAVFWNHPGLAANASGGYTEFTVYANPGVSTAGAASPTASNATFMNMGAVVAGANGGQTSFSATSNAANAHLIARGGINGGGGGTIVFEDEASGGTARVELQGNGTLDISACTAASVKIGSLQATGGCIAAAVGASTTCLIVSKPLTLSGEPIKFVFRSAKGITKGTSYVVLKAPGLGKLSAKNFTGTSVGKAAPSFRIVGTELHVSFGV